MSLTVTDVDALRDYLAGVMERADHHANGVDAISLALAGAILWRKDEDRPIEVMTQSGDTKNVLWVFISGQRYAFSYAHALKRIEMRLGTTQGATLHTFTNDMTITALRQIFSVL